MARPVTMDRKAEITKLTRQAETKAQEWAAARTKLRPQSRVDPFIPECFGWAGECHAMCQVCALRSPCVEIGRLRRLNTRTLREAWVGGAHPSGLVAGSVPDMIRRMLDEWVEYYSLMEKVTRRFGPQHAERTLRWTLKHLAKKRWLWKKVAKDSGATFYRAGKAQQ